MPHTHNAMSEQHLQAIAVQHNPSGSQEDTDTGAAQRTWKPLQLFNSYRLCLSLTIVVLSIANIRPKPLGELDATLFLHASIVYTLASIVFAVLIHQRRPSFNIQIFIHVLADVLAITIMMHASGGIKSGLGVLMIAAVAATQEADP